MKIRIIHYILIVLLVIVIAIPIYMMNFYVPETILKEAVKKNELADKSYILCRWIRVTGFDWIMLQNEEGEKVSELCKISGADPYADLNLSYSFIQGDNTIIFYISNKEVYYDDYGDRILEYSVTGWDILYPIKRVPPEFLWMPRKYITEADQSTKTK